MDGAAVVLAPAAFRTDGAKTAHGLVRGSDRFRVLAVVDPDAAGQDAGAALDGRPRGIPIVATLGEALALRPDTCIVGVATPGGRMTAPLRALLLEAAAAGLTLVNGLHELLADDAELAALAARSGARLVDVRRPRPRAELHFWSGAIRDVRAPRLAVLGTDCAVGKRTTARLLVEGCRAAGLRAEMIYTGQTGWMQGGRHGFVLDATPNDFVSGELEHAIVSCDRAERPELIVLEGQSALRNPSGPCGAELVISGQARGVILQHAPGRREFESHPGWSIPPLEQELQLIRLLGARVLAVTLSGERLDAAALAAAQAALRPLDVPIVRPLEEGAGALVALARAFVVEEGRGG